MLGVFAQAVEGSVPGAFDRLIESGVVGAIAVLAIIGLVVLLRMHLAEKDKRIADAEKVRDSIAEPLKQIQESLRRMEEKIIISKARNNEEN